MVELEVARLLALLGEYLVVGFAVLLLLSIGYTICNAKWKREIINKAPEEAQEQIKALQHINKERTEEIRILRERMDKLMVASRAGREYALQCRKVLEDI